jgi:FkbM family methyltransferase
MWVHNDKYETRTLMQHMINGMALPFKDFFNKHQDILVFGKAARNETLKFVTQFRTAVDIGAHVGISVHQWAPLFEQVHAFEPMVDHFECLELNTSKFGNVTRHNCAMSNQSAMLKGAYRTMKNSGSFQLVDEEFVVVNHKKARIYDIPSKRLDEFELDNVDLIKIDVEGWELEVLQGAKQTIQRCYPVMMIEYTQGGGREHKSMHTYDIQDYLNLIEELGYEQVGVVNDDYIYQVRS